MAVQSDVSLAASFIHQSSVEVGTSGTVLVHYVKSTDVVIVDFVIRGGCRLSAAT